MSEPPTLLIRETDEDRTLLDPLRHAEPDPPFEGSGQALQASESCSPPDEVTPQPRAGWGRLRAKRTGQGRRIVEAGAVLAVLFSLGVLAYQQWQAIESLRAVIDEWNAGRSAVPLEDRIGPAEGVPARSATTPKPATSTTGLASDDRGKAEHQGARLLAANDFEGALAHYQTLAERYPDERVFRDLVTVLKAKLRCTGFAISQSSACP